MTEECVLTLQDIEARDLCVLRLSCEIQFEQRRDFVDNFAEMMESGRGKLVIDLTRVKRLFSVYLGTLVDFQEQATKANKVFTILASKSLLKLFEQANLIELLNVVVPDDKA